MLCAQLFQYIRPRHTKGEMFVSFRQGSEFDCTMRYQQQQQQHAADATTPGLTVDQLPHTNPTLANATSISSSNSTGGTAASQSSGVTSPRGTAHGNNTGTAATGSHSVGPGVTASTAAATTTSAVGFLQHFHSNGFAQPAAAAAAAAAAIEGELVRYGDRCVTVH
jgi:hypothetical protein